MRRDAGLDAGATLIAAEPALDHGRGRDDDPRRRRRRRVLRSPSRSAAASCCRRAPARAAAGRRARALEPRPRRPRPSTPCAAACCSPRTTPSTARSPSAMLGGAGYEVDTVVDGAAAVAAATEKGYDAILMDCQMPDLNGYEATARIRASEGSGRHTPIIALTAGARREDRERCLAEGMDSYLAKPVSKEALLATLGARAAHGLRHRGPGLRHDPRSVGLRGAAHPRRAGSPRRLRHRSRRALRAESEPCLVELRPSLDRRDREAVAPRTRTDEGQLPPARRPPSGAVVRAAGDARARRDS